MYGCVFGLATILNAVASRVVANVASFKKTCKRGDEDKEGQGLSPLIQIVGTFEDSYSLAGLYDSRIKSKCCADNQVE
jgi:hypothetical protein